jgi:phage gpG-like protein
MEIGPRSMRAGVDIEYAKYQQFGTSRIPAREFYYVHEENLESIRKPFEDLCFELMVGT